MPRKNSTTWSVADQITASRLNKINDDFDDIYSKGSDRGRIFPSLSGESLKIDIGSFSYRVGDFSGNHSGEIDFPLIDDEENYIEIDFVGNISKNIVGFDPQKARIGKVVCSGGSIVSIDILKPDVVGGLLGGDGTGKFSAIAGEDISLGDCVCFFPEKGAHETGSRNSSGSIPGGFSNIGVEFMDNGNSMIAKWRPNGNLVGTHRKYTLSSPYNVSSLTYVGDFSYDSLGGNSANHQFWEPRDSVTFSHDGLKMYTYYWEKRTSGGNYDWLMEFTLANPWDISGATFNTRYLNTFSAWVTNDGLTGFMLSNNGTTLKKYSLSSANSFSSKTELQSVELTYCAEIGFSNNGLNLWTGGFSGTSFRLYNLSSAYDLSDVSYAGTFESGVSGSTRSISISRENNGKAMSGFGTTIYGIDFTESGVSEGYFKTDARYSDKVNFLGICKTAGLQGETIEVGYIGDNNQSGLTTNSDVFLSDTPGQMSDTAGTVSKVIGKAVSSSSVVFTY